MDRISIGRYDNEQNPWDGWVETKNWIVFIHKDGTLVAFNGRDPKTGAVLNQGVKV